MSGLTQANPIDAIVFLGLIAGGIFVLSRRQATARFIRANPTMLLFVAYCALSICWSDSPVDALKRWIRAIGDFTMVLIVLTEQDQCRAISWVLSRVAFILIPLSILLIKYYPDLSRSYDPWTGKQFVSGAATDKNMLGMICLVYGLGALWQGLIQYQESKGRERLRQIVAQGAVFGMALWLFSTADSMTSMSCFIMASGLMLVTTLVKSARKPQVVHILVATIISVSYSVLFLHIGEAGALQKLGRNPTLTGRTEIWAGLLNFTASPIFGAGFESFWTGERLQRIWAAGSLFRGINESHNGYLETYLNLGWIGVALLGFLIGTGYRHALTGMRTDARVGILRLSLFTAIVVYNFTEAAFKTESTMWIAFLLATMAIPAVAVRQQRQTPDVKRIPSRKLPMEWNTGAA